jgi:hypothetical protein
MAIIVRKHGSELTLDLYHAGGEPTSPTDIRRELLNLGLEPRLLRRNPDADDVWMLVWELAKNHGTLAATSTALLGIVTLWLKQREGRRIEIERPGLKVKAPNSRELEKILSALHHYDELTIKLNAGKFPTPTEKKKAVAKSSRKTA